MKKIAFVSVALILAACGSQTIAATPTADIPAELLDVSRWIEVDLAASEIRLHSANADAIHIAAATGVADDPRYATPLGVFHVQSMDHGPIESASGVFVRDLIMIDIASGTGIHSVPMDGEGTLLDDRTGPSITAGCVRATDSAAVFAFADLGMPVWIH
ncbi:MAG TPA: L,D-transpeptidase [Anaerolineales bacterium]|nr:L,D-transpeptidase [Anaerolineales bacterium]